GWQAPAPSLISVWSSIEMGAQPLDRRVVGTIRPDDVGGRQDPGADDDGGAERNAERHRAADPAGENGLVRPDEQDVAVVKKEQACARERRDPPATGDQLLEFSGLEHAAGR